MENVFYLNRKRRFTLDEANELLPLIYKITKQYEQPVSQKLIQIKQLRAFGNEEVSHIEEEVRTLVDRWSATVQKLGVEAKGLWTVDIDNGEGFFCWKFPESKILYKHGYKDGFTGRILIDESEKPKYENRNSPDQPDHW